MGGQQEKPTVPKIAFTVQGLKSLLYAESGHFDRRDNELRSLALRVSASGAAAIIFDLFFPVLFLPLGAIARLSVAVQLPPNLIAILAVRRRDRACNRDTRWDSAVSAGLASLNGRHRCRPCSRALPDDPAK